MGSESYCWTNALLLRAATLVTQLLLPIDFSRPLKALHVINKSRNKQSSSSCCSVCTQPHRKRLIFLLSEETARCQSSWNNVRNNFNTLEDCQNQSSSITTNMDVSFPALNVRFDLDCTLISVNLVTRSCNLSTFWTWQKTETFTLCMSVLTSNTSVFSKLHFINTVLPDGVYQTQWRVDLTLTFVKSPTNTQTDWETQIWDQCDRQTRRTVSSTSEQRSCFWRLTQRGERQRYLVTFVL